MRQFYGSKLIIMKRTLYTLFLLLFTSSLFATIRTVSNNPGTVAQFNTIQAAINASSSGDTIYVHGSPNGYGTFTVDRKLAIIGPGWDPDKNLPLQAVIAGSINLTGAAAAGSEIQGLWCVTTISTTTLGVNNIRFVRNRFTNMFINIFPNVGGTVSGYLFESNWFENSQVQSNSSYTIENFLFQNNLFYESGCCVSGNISGFVNTNNVLINHNLFYGPSSNSRDVFASNCRFLLLTNNIFVRRNAAFQNSFSSFTNNITFNTTNDTPWASNSNVNGGGNLAGTDPQMAAQTNVNNGVNDAALDFTIATGPANNAGTDGKDLGLLFDVLGSLNWTNVRNSRLPRIFSMNITNPTVGAGINLNVNVNAKTSN